MIKLVENIPLDTSVIAGLITDRDDLFLVWPGALWPLDHEQWKKLLNPEEGNVPFIVYKDDRAVGHVALRMSDEEHAYNLSLLYIEPALRFQGLGVKIIRLVERYANERLGARKLKLVVRVYNPGALRCYRKCSFREYSRDGTIIRMSKRIKV